MLAQKLKAIKIYKFKSKRERNIAVAALLTVVVFCAFTFVIDPFLESQGRIQEQIPVKLKQLEKYRQFVAGKPRVEMELKQVRHAANQCNAMFLNGVNPSVGGS